MNSLPPNMWSESDFAELEQIVSGAKEFVVPTEQLRPRVVQAAREMDARRSHLAKLRTLLLCALVVWLAVAGVFVGLQKNRRQLTSPGSAEVERLSVEYASRYGYGRDWGMVEVFQQLRGREVSHETLSESKQDAF